MSFFVLTVSSLTARFLSAICFIVLSLSVLACLCLFFTIAFPSDVSFSPLFASSALGGERGIDG